MHGGGKEGFSVFKVGGVSDDDIRNVGDKTSENTLSLSESRTRRKGKLRNTLCFSQLSERIF
jgi:hypothetical protein